MIEHKIPTRSQKTYFQLFFWIPVIIIIICNNHICQKIHGQTKHLLCAFPKFEMLLIIFRIIIFSRNTSVELIVAKQYGSCPLYRRIIWLIESFVIFHASLSFHFLLVLNIYQMFLHKCTFNLSSLRIFQITNKFPCEETLLATLTPHDWHWPQRAFHWPCCMGKMEEGIKAGYMGGGGGYDISVLWIQN